VKEIEDLKVLCGVFFVCILQRVSLRLLSPVGLSSKIDMCISSEANFVGASEANPNWVKAEFKV